MSRIDANANANHHRFANIDLLRGIVMVLMLLDHVRDFVHEHGLTRDPTDLQTTTPALFLTRWVSHFCAPVFVFLAGSSVHLQLLRGMPHRDVARGLLWRGMFFVALEVVVLRPLMWWNLDYAFVAHLQVIWAIGWSMCGLGLLLLTGVPRVAIRAIGLAIVACHNLLPHIAFDFAPWSSLDALRMLGFGRGGIWFGSVDGPVVIAQYALVPWLGVMLAGFACGALWRTTPDRRRRLLVAIGALTTIAFVLLRGLRLYGDPGPWDPDQPGWRAVASFLRCEKYPPSLHYLLMTLGPGLLLLAATERVRADGAWRWLVTLGRVPLFFYLLQWPMAHALSRLFQWLDGQPIGWDGLNPMHLRDLPPGCGFSLEVVWLAWALGLVVLVPVCLWFARFRGRHPDARWLRWL